MISAQVKVYNDVWHIGNCLNNIYDCFDEIVLIEGAWDSLLEQDIPGYNTRRSSDGTLEIIDDFIRKSDVKNKIKYVQLDDSSTKYQPPFDTYPMAFWDVTSCKEGDYSLIIDSDEIYSRNDAASLVEFAVGTEASGLEVWAYNLVSVDEYRSDSLAGPMGIGGRIEKFGHFHTDRFFTAREENTVITVPDIWCFHYSLYKPLIHLEYKYKFKPCIRSFWELQNGKVVFLNDTKVLKYTGILPEGYGR